MFRAPAIACALLSACVMAAFSQEPRHPGELSPTEKTNLRTARPGLPMPPAADTNQYRLTAVSRDEVAWRTQVLAITTVTIITKSTNPAVMVWRNGVYAPYVPAARPVVISVVTQHHDVFQAPEIR